VRLLIPPLDGVTQWQGAKLLVGRASSSVSKDLPLPPDAHVFGSIVCDDRRYESVFVAFSETAEQVYMTFQDRLLAAGWHADDQSASQRADLRFRRDAYVCGKDGPCVYIYASPSPGRATRVRLDIVRDPSQTPRGRRRIQRLWDLPGKLPRPLWSLPRPPPRPHPAPRRRHTRRRRWPRPPGAVARAVRLRITRGATLRSGGPAVPNACSETWRAPRSIGSPAVPKR
jgi:hypothetical protein